MSEYPNEPAAFDQRNDLFKTDSAFADQPRILLRIEKIIPISQIAWYDNVCLMSIFARLCPSLRWGDPANNFGSSSQNLPFVKNALSPPRGRGDILLCHAQAIASGSDSRAGAKAPD